MGKKDTPVFFQIWGAAFFLPCNITLTRSLSNMVSIKLMHAPSISGFVGDFYHGRILDFVKGFFCICWNDHVISVLRPIYMLYCIVFTDLHAWNHPYIPRLKPIWSLWMIFLMCCWIQFASLLLRIFACPFIQ